MMPFEPKREEDYPCHRSFGQFLLEQSLLGQNWIGGSPRASYADKARMGTKSHETSKEAENSGWRWVPERGAVFWHYTAKGTDGPLGLCKVAGLGEGGHSGRRSSSGQGKTVGRHSWFSMEDSQLWGLG